MKGRAVRRLGVAAVLLVCLAAIVGSACGGHSQELSISDVTVNEDAGTASFTISLTRRRQDRTDAERRTGRRATARLLRRRRTTRASSGTDGRSRRAARSTVEVPIANDSIDEFDENFTVTLSRSGARIDRRRHGYRHDHGQRRPADRATIGDATVAEGMGAVDADFIVSLSGAEREADHDQLLDGSTARRRQPSDYTAEINQNLTINPGATSGTISIAVNGDTTSPRRTRTFTGQPQQRHERDDRQTRRDWHDHG